MALSPTHLSYYHLTLEPNTVFAAKPPPNLPDEDAAWSLQEQGQAILAEHGFRQYEISAYAKSGMQCAHNLNYWRYGDYLGIGAGAHGKISSGASGEILRRWKLKNPRDYLQHAKTEKCIGGDEYVTMENRPFDFMLNALRLSEGFSIRDFEVRTGLERAAIEKKLAHAKLVGWLLEQGDVIIPTEFGQRFSNDVMALFLAD
jgi:oxygen-independent coproporphyrinogen-3 oxidase